MQGLEKQGIAEHRRDEASSQETAAKEWHHPHQDPRPAAKMEC